MAAASALAGCLPPARQAGLRWLRDPLSGERLDQALVIAFPGPASFTGEDCVELHLHGSRAVIDAVSAALARLPQVRLAGPGEFTRRALLHDRIDLAQVEGLGDLLAAETAAQRAQALALMQGALSGLVTAWRSEIVRALAFVEATIDFADEELPDVVIAGAVAGLEGVGAAMRRELGGAQASERIREGFEVALVGPPNVGKSTLLNRIAGREVALTSNEAGTTRDVLEVRLDLGGMSVTLLDTAGMREADGRIEAMGVARGRARAAAADLRVFLVDAADDIAALGISPAAGDIVALAKSDLRAEVSDAVSGVTGAGVDGLLERVTVTLGERVAGASTVAHARQREALARAEAAVVRALGELRGPGAVELAAEELRTAVRALDFLTGRVDVEAVLDVIFASFCLGK